MDLLRHLFQAKATAEEEEEKRDPEESASGVRYSPLRSGTERVAGQFSLRLGDLLPRIPTPALITGLHDPERCLYFPAAELVDGIAQGRVVVTLDLLAERYPELFQPPASAAQNLSITLPIQKLVHQDEPEEPDEHKEKSVPETSSVEENERMSEFAAPAPPITSESRLPKAPQPLGVAPVPPMIRAPSLVQPPPGASAPAEPARVSIPRPSFAPPEAASETDTALEKAAQPGPRTLPAFEPPKTAVLAPARVPALRVEQEPLQAIFMTGEQLDLRRVSELAAELPGIAGCTILMGENLTQSGEQPPGLKAATLRELSRSLAKAVNDIQEELPAEPTFTLYGGNGALSLFARPDFCLCVVHGSRGFLPGVRERLAAVADTLARGV